MSRSFAYRPDSFVTTESTVWRSTLVIVTVTPGNAAPLVSVTDPWMAPYTACADAGEASHTSALATVSPTCIARSVVLRNIEPPVTTVAGSGGKCSSGRAVQIYAAGACPTVTLEIDVTLSSAWREQGPMGRRLLCDWRH